MLDNLSTIRWDRLGHAHGKASDVPGLLLGLSSQNPDVRDESLQTLFGTIWHQGTVYPATLAAVPFLCELLRIEEVRDKENILGLLHAIQTAYPRSDAKPDPIWRDKPSAWDIKRNAVSAKWARRNRNAVSAETGTYVLLLNDPSPLVRRQAANILAGCRARSAMIRRQIEQAIDNESDPDAKSCLIDAWYRGPKGVRKTREVAAKLRGLAFDASEKPVVRVISAVGLTPFLKERSYSKWVRFLARIHRKCDRDLQLLSRFDDEFNPLDAVKNHANIRLELFLEFAKKPNRLMKQILCTHLQFFCRENRDYFEKLIPVFGEFLSENDSEFRESVACQLSQMGAWCRFARTHLVRALKDSNPMVALWAAVALSKLRDPNVPPFVVENLAPERHADVQERPAGGPLSWTETNRVGKELQYLRELLNALRPFGPDGREALPQLRELFINRGKQIQELVCPALAAIGEPARDMVPLVANLLKNPEIRGVAASALMQWGPMAVEAIPDLAELLNRRVPTDSWAATSAITALGRMGSAAECALPALMTLLRDPDGEFKCAAALAIWQIAPGTHGVIDALLAELQAKTMPGWATHGCALVIETLGKIGPAARLAIPLLKKLLDDPNGWVRVHLARTLWKTGEDLNLILPVLMDDLLCRPLGIRVGMLAAECLADIGQPAAAAVPRLKEILARDDSFAHFGTGWVESDESYRESLMHALATISGDIGLVRPGAYDS